MTERLAELLERYINEELILAVCSDPAFRSEDIPSKMKIRPVKLKGRILYQAALTIGTREIHENNDAKTTIGRIIEMAAGSPRFGQIEITGPLKTATVLISRKGHITIKERQNKSRSAMDAGNRDDLRTGSSPQKGGTQNRVKNHILKEGVPVPFLVELGVMNREGYVVGAYYDKFRQINRYLEFVDDIVPELCRRIEASGKETGRKLEIIDFGCGRSYLTFALYHFLHVSKKLDVHILGLDLKKDVMEHCSALAKKLGCEGLEFLCGDIADHRADGPVDMVVTLHACDTATDYALYNAVRWNAGVIFCVPCCQHELNGQIRNSLLEPVLRYGIIKERMSALITDAVRADILEEHGYKTQILEFIDMEHTPKNLLIRAVKREGMIGPYMKSKTGSGSGRFLEELGSELTLHRLFEQNK